MYSRWEPTNNISEKKIQEDGSRPNLGLDLGGVSGKLNIYCAVKFLFLKIEG